MGSLYMYIYIYMYTHGIHAYTWLCFTSASRVCVCFVLTGCGQTQKRVVIQNRITRKMVCMVLIAQVSEQYNGNPKSDYPMFLSGHHRSSALTKLDNPKIGLPEI